jgi:recombination protein RecA
LEVANQLEILEKVRKDVEKKFGTNSLIKMDGSNVIAVPRESTNFLGLDDILGGGYGKGRIVEIYGPESSGKTSLALHAIAAIQSRGGIAAFIDAEHALDPMYAQNLGVDIGNLWLSQPDNGEQALEIAESLVDSTVVSIIVIDSVSALTPKAEIEGDMGDSHVGLQARLMSQAMRKLTGKLSKTGTILLFINQIRNKIGIMFGSNETTSGGNALKFYASQRLDVRKIETVEKDGENATANRVRVKIVKNKLSPPFRKREFLLEFGKGINKYADLVDMAVEKEIIEKKGAWYSYKDEKLGQGNVNAYMTLSNNKELYKEIYDLVSMKL